MPIGGGKYDAEVTELREKIGADGVMVAVVGGNKGAGFCVQFKSALMLFSLPKVLRDIADQIERDMKEIGGNE